MAVADDLGRPYGDEALGDHMESPIWYVRHGSGACVGPFTAQQLEAGLRAGQLGPNALVCLVGETGWAPLMAHGLFASVAGALPSPSPAIERGPSSSLFVEGLRQPPRAVDIAVLLAIGVAYAIAAAFMSSPLPLIWAGCAIGTYIDARRNDMARQGRGRGASSPIGWAIVVALTALLGVICYLIARSRYGAKVRDYRFAAIIGGGTMMASFFVSMWLGILSSLSPTAASTAALEMPRSRETATEKSPSAKPSSEPTQQAPRSLKPARTTAPAVPNRAARPTAAASAAGAVAANPDPEAAGKLAATEVQRIVRQNFGRFRLCYEDGLRTNPDLSGRVSTKFVIAPDGSVSMPSDAGSDLPDASVVGCVVRNFGKLQFPSSGGKMTVVYPISFSPGN